MKPFRSLSILLAASFIYGALPGVSYAQIPKQGKFDVISTFDLVVVESKKFGDKSQNLISSSGINFNKSGSGFLHNTATYCMFVTSAGSFHGYCTITDADGDYVFHHNFMEQGFDLGTTGGGRRMVILGGTGKYEGIKGEAAYEFVYAPKIEGKLLGHAAISGSYRIP